MDEHREERFHRTMMLLGDEGFAALESSRVTVVGLGAVGSFAAEALSRMGVGELRLVDFDRVSRSNINRQLYALESTIGLLKTHVAQRRILDINPSCRVETLDCFVDAGNVDEIIDLPADIVVDAIDGVGPKSLLLSRCITRGIPVVSSMGAARKTDPFAVKAGSLSDIVSCPLGLRVRKRLWKEGLRYGVRCIFSTERAVVCAGKPYAGEDVSVRGRVRQPMGSLSAITGIFGLLASHETVRMLLCGKGIAPVSPTFPTEV